MSNTRQTPPSDFPSSQEALESDDDAREACETPPSAVPASQDAPSYSQEMAEADAWWQSLHGELIAKAVRNQPARPELIPRPLAAYRFGLLSRCIWIRNKSVWESPGDQSTQSGVPSAPSASSARRAVPWVPYSTAGSIWSRPASSTPSTG